MTEPLPEETPQEAGNETENEAGALRAELAKMKDQMLRAVAEAENIRKRGEKERVDIARYAIAGFARELINVSDNLRRALDAVPEAERNSAIYTGVEATEREMLRIFESTGIRKIVPHGEAFNPNFHEVMFEVESADHPPGTVLQVMEAGYALHDRLLRPARVGVAKNSSQEHKPVLDEKV